VNDRVTPERLGRMDREKVESMPVGQAVAIHTARSVTHAYHEVLKNSLLPNDEAMRRLPVVMKQLQQDVVRPDALLSGRAGLPIASILLPAVQNVMQAEVRATRNIAALQAIEAIRMHAAANDGKLPQKLADVTIVPVPADAASATATLDMSPIVGWPARAVAKRYIIKLEK